jgi:peptidoglycan/xylan/chitin deacetylase (PgdA/CDA1 family)
VTRGSNNVGRALPILCFHAIEEGPGPLCFPPAAFKRQVRRLREAGWRSLVVSEVAAHIAAGRGFPRQALAFTFDDGFASVHSGALDALDAAGFTATVYPATAYLGGVSSWMDGEASRLRMLAPAQLRELHAAGWEVGGHTHSHASLPALGEAEIAAELGASTEILEDLVGGPVRTFAYPYGLHDARSRAAASAVYEACVENGASKATASSPLDRLERVEAWYLRRAWQLDHLDDWLGDAYLALRRAGRALRRRATPPRAAPGLAPSGLRWESRPRPPDGASGAPRGE